MKMDWRSWCKLCGNCEAFVRKSEPGVVEICQKLFDEFDNDGNYCSECHNFLNQMYKFVARTKLIETMFQEISAHIENPTGITENSWDEIDNIRIKFGCKPMRQENETLNVTFYEENLVEVKVENEFSSRNISSDKNDILNQSANEFKFDDGEDHLEEEYIEEDDIYEQEEVDQNKTETRSAKKNREKLKRKQDMKTFDFVCHICQVEFEKMIYLTRHCRDVHNCLPKVSCICGKTLGTWKRLMIHKQLHFPGINNVAYECKDCKLIYKLKSTFDNHMITKHGPGAQKFICKECSKSFKDSRTLTSHERTHLPDCLKLTHPCTTCDKKFVNKNSLKAHITSVHDMALIYTCETCGKGFTSKSNLKSHLYVHSNIKNIQCDICSACFKNMDSLRKHKKTHLEKNHECKICGNLYRNRNNLKAHMVCHSNVKAFQCTFCSNSYKRSKDLKCHLHLHTGERPYSCPWCSRTFVNGSNCRKHKLKEHPDELLAFESLHGRGKSAVQALQDLQA